MKNNLVLNGTIKQINDRETGVSKAGKDWEKMTFVLDQGSEYNPEVCFSIFGAEKVDNFIKYNKPGDVVNVSFNVSSREFNGKYYHNLDVWRVDQDGTTSAPAEQPTATDTTSDDDDDLPF